MTVSGHDVPRVIRLLAEPLRWRLASELARGDQRVRELVTATGQPQNLVSYHLRQLRHGGLVSARRSSFDARDTYYSLNLEGCGQALADAAAVLHPGLCPAVRPAVHPAVHPGLRPAVRPAAGRNRRTRRVLFVCTGNSSRSPMAEALLRSRAGAGVKAASAGIRPKPVHPEAVAVLASRYRLDISRHQPAHVGTAAGQRFDYVISLCDRAREACPEFPCRPARIHWSLPDPAAGEGGLSGTAAFERTAAELDTRIRFLLPLLSGTGPAAAYSG